MSRTADSTIKGFLYQFNKTIYEILVSDDDEIITVEGLVEDVDIINGVGNINAIQCKYHEDVQKYTDSLIFKPLLQMAEAFSKRKENNTKYTIFLHVPNEEYRTVKLEKKVIENALKTKNEKLKKIVERINPGFEIDEFVKLVHIEFAKSIDELEIEVKTELEKLRLTVTDVECILYPNAINHIAKLSSLKDEDDRKITKSKLIILLSTITTTAITKWTLLLKSKKKLLETMKKQLSYGLAQNSRARYFHFAKNDILNFDEQVVVFIDNYVKKYHYKLLHDKTPIFSIDAGLDEIKELTLRLYRKQLIANNGIIGDSFIFEFFFRDPIVKAHRGKIQSRDIDINLLSFNEQAEALNRKKGDDIFFICNIIPASIDTRDTNSHHIGVCNFNELEFILGMRGTYE
jgi:hypothetical protein